MTNVSTVPENEKGRIGRDPYAILRPEFQVNSCHKARYRRELQRLLVDTKNRKSLVTSELAERIGLPHETMDRVLYHTHDVQQKTVQKVIDGLRGILADEL